ncbi:MAG: Ig-like domain-containing protein [Planctomycetes bacterium]|nr:Ig-like domain-containing protein [Planctomycetota bacterium]
MHLGPRFASLWSLPVAGLLAAGPVTSQTHQVQPGGPSRPARGIVGPYPAVLTQTSPASGEAGVSLTRETILRFDQPLDPTSAFTGAISVTSVGQNLPFSPRVSANRRALTLFYVQPLPESRRVRVTVDGALLLDAEGRLVDADGDGVPGGTRSFEFDTTALAPFPGTKVSGRVFASELAPGGGPINVPLEGVRVAVDGAESTLFALTDANGNFTLDPAPAGRIFVHIDGTTATNPVPVGGYYPKVGKAWDTRPGQELVVGDAYLPLVPVGTLQPVSTTSATTLTFAPGVLAAHPEFVGTQITVPAGSLFYDDGTPGIQVGIAPVPPDRLPGPLPAGLEFPIVITVQTDGASNFDAPAPVRFPNLPLPSTGQPLAPGAEAMIWSFNHDSGQWESVAPAIVSSNGLFIESQGSGVLAPGWHGALPGQGLLEPPRDRGCQGWSGCLTATGVNSLNCAAAWIPGLGISNNPCIQSLMQQGLGTSSTCLSGNPTTCRAKLLWSAQSATRSCLSGSLKFIPYLGQALACGGAIWNIYHTCACELLAVPPNPAAGLLSALGHWGRCHELVLGSPLWTNAIDPLQDSVEASNSIARIIDQVGTAIDDGSPGGELITSAEAAVLLALPRPSMIIAQDVQGMIDHVNRTTALWTQGVYTHAQAGQSDFTDRDDLVATLGLLQVSLLGVGTPAGVERFTVFDEIRTMYEQGIGTVSDANATPTPSQSIAFAAYEPGSSSVIQGNVNTLTSNRFPFNRQIHIKLLDRTNLDFAFTSVVTPRLLCSSSSGGGGSCVLFPPIPYMPSAIFVPNEILPDSDQDGLSDEGEFVVGTSAADPDSDDDGVTDAAEILQGLNPLDGVTIATGIIATAPTAATALDVATFGDLAIVARGTAGISAFNVFNAMPPVLVARVDTPGDAREADLSERYVAVADGPGGLAILNVEDLATAAILHQVPTTSLGGGAVQTVAVAGGLVFVGTGAGHVASVELSTGAVLDILDLGASVHDFAIEGERLFVLADSLIRELRVFDLPLSVLASAPVEGTTPLATGRRRLFVGDGTAYATHMRGFHTFDVRTRGMILPLGGGDTGQVGWTQVVANGSRLGVAAVGPNSADVLHDLALYDFTNPSETSLPQTFVTSFLTPGLARSVCIYGGLAYVADSASGLQVVNYRGYDALGVPPVIALLPSPDLPQYTERTTLLLRASASDDVQIRAVELLLDGQRVQTDGAFPFQFFLELPEHVGVGSNTHTLQLRATDTGGNAASTPPRNFDVVADSTPPQVVATFPGASATLPPSFFGTFAFSVLASEALDVAALGTAFEVRSAGNDNAVGTMDDVLLPFDARLTAGDRRVVVRVTAAVPLGDLRLRFLAAQVRDRNGNAFDGDANGTGGDDFALDVHVTSEFTVFWDGGGNGTAWDDAANWSTNLVPGASDRVLIDAPLSNVAHTTGASGILKLVARTPLALSSGTLTLQEASSVGVFALSGTGVVSGPGDLNVTGSSTWSAGRIEGAGRLVVASGGSLSTSTNAPDRQRVLENHGLVVLGGNLIGPLIENATDGLLRAQGSCSLSGSPMVNDGIVRVDSGQLRVRSTTWTNNGPIYVDGGVLVVDSVGPSNMLNQGLIGVGAGATMRIQSVLQSTGTIQGAGGVTVVQGATATIDGPFLISGPYVHSAGVASFAAGRFLASGSVTITSGMLTIRNPIVASSFTGIGSAHVVFNAPQTLASVSLSGGILDGSGEITITSVLSMTGSELRGTGLLRAAFGATVTLAGAPQPFDRPFENHGVVQVTAGEWRGAGARVNGSDGVIVVTGGGIAGDALTNQGALRVAGTGYLRVSDLQNLGTIAILSGEGSLGGGGTSALTNSGTLSVSAGATLRHAGGALTSTGPIQSAGSVVLANGTSSIQGPLTCAQLFQMTGGVHGFSPGAFMVSGPVELVGGQITFRDTIVASSFAGPNGAHVIFEAPQTFPTFTLASPGILDGTADVTVTGTLSCSPSEIRAGGRLILAPGSTASISGAGTLPLGRVIENHGAVTMNVGRIQLEGAGGVENASDGTFEMQGESDFSQANPTSTSIANAGLLRHTGGGTAELAALVLTNTGTFENLSGTMRFQQGWGNAGVLVAAPGAVLRTQGALTLGAGSTLRLGLDSTASFGTCVVTGAMTSGGLLDIIVGGVYVPMLGDAFPVITHASGTGTFSALQGDQLGGGLALVPAYSAAGMTMNVQ